MYRVGITGVIGSGKTTVCKVFEHLGIDCYNADLEARNIADNHPVIIQKVKETFGNGIYRNGKLNRKAMADIVFKDKSLLLKLENIIHPAVFEHFTVWLRSARGPYVIHESAVLIETNKCNFVDRILLVTAPEQLMIKRVMKRDGLSRQQVKDRMNSQYGQEHKREFSDDIIVNDDIELVVPQVLRLHQFYTQLAK